MPEESLGLTQK